MECAAVNCRKEATWVYNTSTTPWLIDTRVEDAAYFCDCHGEDIMSDFSDMVGGPIGAIWIEGEW